MYYERGEVKSENGFFVESLMQNQGARWRCGMLARRASEGNEHLSLARRANDRRHTQFCNSRQYVSKPLDPTVSEKHDGSLGSPASDTAVWGSFQEPSSS